MQVGEILKELREDKGLTQRELAPLLGVSAATVSAYEVGIRDPGLDMLIKYSRIFDVSTDYILGLTGVPQSYALLSGEYADGVSGGELVKSLYRLEPEHRSAILTALENIQFYAAILEQTKKRRDNVK